MTWNFSTAASATPAPSFSPALSSPRPGRIDVFDVLDPLAEDDIDEVMEHWWIDPANGVTKWQGPDQMFGTSVLCGSPVVVSRRGSDDLDVFCLSGQTPNQVLLHRSYTDAQGWAELEQLPDSQGSGPPAAVSWGPGRIDVFAASQAANPNSPVTHWWTDPVNANPGWHTDSSLQGTVAGVPSVVSWGSERLDVFANNASDELQHWFFDQPNGYEFGAPEIVRA